HQEFPPSGGILDARWGDSRAERVRPTRWVRRTRGQADSGATRSSGPSIPLPTLFSFGLAGALDILAAGRGTPRLDAPWPSGSGRSPSASASGLGRIAGIRLWTRATSSLGVVVTIVQL